MDPCANDVKMDPLMGALPFAAATIGFMWCHAM